MFGALATSVADRLSTDLLLKALREDPSSASTVAGALYARNYKKALAAAKRIVGTDAAAQDVVQEWYLNTDKYIREGRYDAPGAVYKFDSERDFNRYLFTSVKNIAVSWIRKQKKYKLASQYASTSEQEDIELPTTASDAAREASPELLTFQSREKKAPRTISDYKIGLRREAINYLPDLEKLVMLSLMEEVTVPGKRAGRTITRRAQVREVAARLGLTVTEISEIKKAAVKHIEEFVVEGKRETSPYDLFGFGNTGSRSAPWGTIALVLAAAGGLWLLFRNKGS